MSKISNIIKSVRLKLFITISAIILAIILFLILFNNCIFAEFYKSSKINSLKEVFNEIHKYIERLNDEDIKKYMEELAIKNDFDIVIKNEKNISVYTSNEDFFGTFKEINNTADSFYFNKKSKAIEKNDKYDIIETKDYTNNITYIMLSSKLQNGIYVYIRMPINSIYESVNISNNFLLLPNIYKKY